MRTTKTTATSPTPPARSSTGLGTAQDSLRRLENVDRSLWATAILVMLLLVFALYSYSLVVTGSNWAPDLGKVTYGLIFVVALFAVFAIHKHLLIYRLRGQLASQMNLAAALQTRAEAFQKLAILDPLTGLYNRRFVLQQLPLELARAERCGYRVTALMLDLNGLKQINDRYSHLAGDLALREFASGLRRAIRSSDVAVRLGGDEFLVVLPDCDSSDVARVLARLTELKFSFHRQTIPIAYSAGWAEYTVGEKPEALLARADQKLYEDKLTGSAGQSARAVHEHLREAEKMELMGRFTGSVAHEFNNLLTIVSGYSEMLLHDSNVNSLLHAPLEHIHVAADRAAKLTGQLLAFSRRQALDPKPLSVPALISSMDVLLQRMLTDEISLTVEAQPEVHDIRADSGQIQQIILHLAVNARASIQGNGRVAFELSDFRMDQDFVAAHPGARVGDYVRLAVRDSGLGMDIATKKQLFEPCSQAGAHKKSCIGLTTVYGVLKQNGGYIWVDSVPENGTCVTVYLPWAVNAVAELPERLLPVPKKNAGISGARTVLVVENFDGLRAFMSDFLQNAGYRVLQAANGEQAIRLVADSEEQVDVMICDVVLPGMSGLELGECLVTQHRDIQVLYVAGYAEDAVLYREWLRGSAHLLVAPFSSDELRKKLQEMAEERTVEPAEPAPDATVDRQAALGA